MVSYSSNDLKNVTIYRFHSKRYLPKQFTNFFQFFIDGEYLARQQGRFAGANLNPGFYFSLSQKACIFEMLYYERATLPPELLEPTVKEILTNLHSTGKDRVLLTCEASFENILNLLWPKSLWGVLRTCFPNLRRPDHVDSGTVILKLAGTEMGGSLLTDIIGKYAYQYLRQKQTKKVGLFG